MNVDKRIDIVLQALVSLLSKTEAAMEEFTQYEVPFLRHLRPGPTTGALHCAVTRHA